MENIPQRRNYQLPFMGNHKIAVAPATTITGTIKFFESELQSGPTNPNRQYQNFGGPLSDKVELDILAMSIIPNINFALLEVGGTTDDAFNYFATCSYVKLYVGNLPRAAFPLILLIPQQVVLDADGSWIIQVPENRAEMFELPAPIHVPPSSKIIVELIPAAGLTTGASAATVPHYPGISGGGSNSRAFVIDTTIVGIQHTDSLEVVVGLV